MDRFHCRTPGANETNLCFNGGNCIISGDTERCSCPDGWGPDNVLFHQDNALMVAFIFMSVATVICLAALFSVRAKARGRARTVLRLAGITVTLVWTQVLSLWLENGSFVSTPIMQCLVTSCASIWAGNIAEMVALPIFAIQPHVQAKVQLLIRCMFGLIILTNAGPDLGMAIAASQGDPVLFNRIVLVHIYLLLITEVAFAGVVWIYGNRLIDRLMNLSDVQHNRSAENAEIVKKIKGLQSGAWSLVWGQIPSTIAGGVFLGLGSVPFVWALTFTLFSTASPTITWTTVGVFRSTTKSSNQVAASKSSKTGDVVASSVMVNPQLKSNDESLKTYNSNQGSKRSSQNVISTSVLDQPVHDE